MGRNAQRRRIMRPLLRAARLGRVELGSDGLPRRVVVDQSAGRSHGRLPDGTLVSSPGPFQRLVDLVQALARREAR